MRIASWFDRNLWAISILVFAIAEFGLSLWSYLSDKPVLLASLAPSLRQPVYSSLTGTTSSLLGFVITAIAILAAFGPRAPKDALEDSKERRMARARDRITVSLLAAAMFLLALLILASFGIATDTRRVGNWLLNILSLGAACASLVGLLISGAGVALAVLERNR